MTETLSHALPDDLERLVHEVLQEACDRDLKLVTAESCTGGLLASVLTDVEGCGHAFERAFVPYTEDAKALCLDVPPDLLRRFTAVSAPVAEAMARGALARSQGDIAVSITGFAGRGAPDEESGLVHFAVLRRGHDLALHEAHFGDIGRGPVRLACLRKALEMLREAIAAAPGEEHT
jgi:nicotinamide-nucleotide amidase